MSKDIDWSNLGFSYIKMDKCYIFYWKDGEWDEGMLIEDNMLYISEGLIVFYYG